MVFFKLNRGIEKEMPSALTDGYAYFCTDTGNFYIDWADTDSVLHRQPLNARCAYSLRYLDGDEYIEISSSAVSLAIANLNAHIADTNNPHKLLPEQIGADPAGTAANILSAHDVSESSHADMRKEIGNMVSKSDTVTMIGIDADGVSHTWTIYGVAQ